MSRYAKSFAVTLLLVLFLFDGLQLTTGVSYARIKQFIQNARYPIVYTRHSRRKPPIYTNDEYVDDIVEVFSLQRPPPEEPDFTSEELDRIIRCDFNPSLRECELLQQTTVQPPRRRKPTKKVPEPPPTQRIPDSQPAWPSWRYDATQPNQETATTTTAATTSTTPHSREPENLPFFPSEPDELTTTTPSIWVSGYDESTTITPTEDLPLLPNIPDVENEEDDEGDEGDEADDTGVTDYNNNNDDYGEGDRNDDYDENVDADNDENYNDEEDNNNGDNSYDN